MVVRQKDDLEASHRKVVANLKEKIKSSSDRITELQSQIV